MNCSETSFKEILLYEDYAHLQIKSMAIVDSRIEKKANKRILARSTRISILYIKYREGNKISIMQKRLDA
jgi:hypothetical protein